MKNDIGYLAEKAAKGDEQSFIELCNIMKVPLFRAAMGILGNEQLALDAISETTYKAYKSISKLREYKYAATWLTRILINAATDIYNRQNRYVPLETAQEIAHYDSHDKLNFDELTASLPNDLRIIVSLKYYSEFTLEEIAKILDTPIGTVKSRLNRALKQLRIENTERS